MQNVGGKESIYQADVRPLRSLPGTGQHPVAAFLFAGRPYLQRLLFQNRLNCPVDDFHQRSQLGTSFT